MLYLIITGGIIKNYASYNELVGAADGIICADGGLRHMRNWRRLPDLVIGDFDSCDPKLLSEFEEKNITVRRFPSEKDQTDTELALSEGIHRGAKKIIILGGTGNRLDHTLGNIHCLVHAMQEGIEAKIVDEHNSIQLIKKEVILENDFGRYVSLIPLTTYVKGLTTVGLKYELDDYTLSYGKTLGVSNEIMQDPATIRIDEGILILIRSRD